AARGRRRPSHSGRRSPPARRPGFVWRFPPPSGGAEWDLSSRQTTSSKGVTEIRHATTSRNDVTVVLDASRASVPDPCSAIGRAAPGNRPAFSQIWTPHLVYSPSPAPAI